ncbi:MAG TPA: condensation domain-containing protein, partial [Thermoanaerobaculia bacterium]|nr:condensation domain-containing protein [Thermoanaerobaculia bacterium]
EEAAPPAGLDTLDGVRRWLAAEVAARVGVAAADIDPAQPISHYPLDSLNAMELMHAIEARLGVTVSMETFFEGLSLTELATGVLARAAGTAASAARVQGAEGAAASPAPVAGHEVGEHRLSRGQQSLWFLHALDPGSAAYNVPNAVRIRGELDAAALLRSIQTLVDRHAALRTTFKTSRGEPVQLVHPRMDLEFVSLDAQGWSDARLGEHLARETHRPFDLEKGPLVRVSLFTRSAQEHVLHLTMHHIVTDFWSLGVLIDELAILYPAYTAGESRELPRAPLHYTDYVRWQEEMLAGADGERLWGYWKERLAGELPVLDLTTDRPRPLVQTYGGENHPFRLSRELTARVKEIAREREATPFIALLAAFQALLQRHTRQDDLLVGSVTAARTRAGFAKTIGYFVNPLVLRADLAGDPPFEAFLARARRDALGAFEHQEYPFPLLVEKLQPQRDPGRSPLFQVMFVLQKAHLADGQDLTACALGEPGARADVGGLRLEAMPLPQKIAQFDLTLTMGEVEGALVAALDYNTDLFDAATIARMARHFERLLEGVAADPGTPLSELPLVTETEARQLVAAWNDTRVEYRRDATLHRLFEEQAEKSPEAPAMMFGRERISYGELNERANRLAHHLRRLGVGPEALTGICVDRSLDMMVGILGVLKAGGAYLPLDPDYPRERMSYILGDAGAKLLLTQQRLRPLLDSDPPPVQRLEIDADWPAIAARPAGNPPPLATAGNLACVIYTSGSTGLPKGVLLDHRNVVNLVSSFLRSYEPGPEDRILPLTSIAYASFVGEIFPLLCAGGAVVLPDKHELLDVTALVGLIARHGVSMVSTVPSMMANLNALRGELPRLRLILVGGEALSAGDVDQLIDSVRIVNGYGLTETTICS